MDGWIPPGRRKIGCSVVWQENNREWAGQKTHLGTNREVYDAELYAIEQAICRFTERDHKNRHYTIFSDSKSAIERCRNDKPGPGQSTARLIIDGSLRLAINRCEVSLRWAPAHKGVNGNEMADQWAKAAAKQSGEEVNRATTEASLAFLKRKTSEVRKEATRRWIRERTAKSKAYIPREEGMRKNLKNEKKGVAARYYQLMTGHAIIVPYLKEKRRKRDSDMCWWCESGKRQTREHLFKECVRWKSEIKDLWRKVGRDVGWRRAKWKSVAQLFREESAEEAVLEFVRRTGVGKMSGSRGPRAEGEMSDAESEG
jgi:ribonuclease HI